MYISECINKYLPEIKYQSVAEREIDSLGWILSETPVSVCSFVEDERYLNLITKKVKMLFVTSDIVEKVDLEKVGCIVVDNPKLTFFLLHNKLKNNNKYVRESFETEISETAKISNLAYIEQKNVKIGNNVIIEPFVTVYENTVIEDNCIIRSGAKIGGEGIQAIKYNNEIILMEHLGGTILHHDVEIQNNSCVDKAIYPWDNTEVGEHTKISEFVQVAHAVKIGKSCLIVGHIEIGGRCIVGDNVWIGIGSIIRNGIKIGNNARVNMGSVVARNVKESESVTGNFAITHEKFLEFYRKILRI